MVCVYVCMHIHVCLIYICEYLLSPSSGALAKYLGLKIYE